MRRDRPVRLFVLVSARDRLRVREKIRELLSIGVRFVVICGEKSSQPAVHYRQKIGKWDAINYGSRFIPPQAEVVVLNDVDTRIHNLERALGYLNKADMVICKVRVGSGPQKKFYRILDPIRKYVPIAASGELMLLKRELFNRLIPLPPCTAEDSYMMFRAIELGYHVKFIKETFITTERTFDPVEEQAYKIRTTLGIYQSLQLTHPPPYVRAFYRLLPLIAILLTIGGPDGRAWAIGIEKATVMHMLKKYGQSF
jgi:cellulose synthase/poly-beta-1,6-N-acetylglucosamine synthase-like glycosyltransferase